ncbi:hypothetical protein PENNAL_c0313G00608 [Penicillium nalgiovense]|uniref:DUF7779 domain-containing protein n=1 Tax=Penicillium nalgiovense TaxID=60175 RepID=A0A1V6WBE8_PENNA|nr:hypothetical protein PENNAL_c0313G00608 [Penicillium nalgiovense]
MASTSHSGVNYGAQVGINYGTFTADFHLPPERAETPPSPLSTVPFTRDPDFVRRDKLLDQIYNKSSVAGSRIALIGLGGVGKSELAIEYSYQVRSKSPATWVFWVHASNEARFEQSFRDIADQVKIPGRQDAKVNIFKLVENWLRDEKIGNWVCILDNVDDDQLLCSGSVAGKRDPMSGSTNASTKPLLEYVPRSQNGSIIITSRTREVALKMVHHSDLIEVTPMEKSEALELLQRKLEQPGESQESRQLVNALESMPLAVVQAASYIRNRAPRSSVSQYLKDFLGSDREATKLLKKEAGHLYRDWEAKNSILVTWQISFDYIRQTKPSAADLLSLMSFFDRQGIPESLIRHQPKANDTSISEPLSDSSDGESSESDIGPDLEDDLTTLRDYSLISVSKDGTLFTIHRLVQLSTRAWLKSYGQVQEWREKSIRILAEEFPSGDYVNWEKCRVLYPHVKSAMSQRPESSGCRLELAALLYRGAWYAWESGLFGDMTQMASQSRKQRVTILGAENETALESTAMLAMARREQGRWEEAQHLWVQVMETRKRKLGEDHPDTLASMHNLASTYIHQGRWKEAAQLNIQVVITSKTKLGDDHHFTLTSMANLASTYLQQGRWKEAEQLNVQVVNISKKKLGEDHFDSLASMVNLASTYSYQGRWKEAEHLEVWVMKIRMVRLGEGHPSTLKSKANLASTYLQQGRWKEAEQLNVQVVNISKKELGEDHFDTLTSMANLAMIYSHQGRWKEAEQLNVRVMETRKMKLGDNHPDTLTSMTNLAVTYMEQGQWEEAEHLNVQVVDTSKTKFGENHPFTLVSMANLSSTYLQQGRWNEAEQLNLKVMEARRTKFGGGHPDTLTSMANLASTYSHQGRWKEAEQLNVRVMETRKMKLGEDHPDTLTSTANLAVTYMHQGRWKEAEQLIVQVVESRKAKLGEDHPDMLTSMANLAFTWKFLGHDTKAIHLLRDCLSKQRGTLGSNHPRTLSTSQTLLAWETKKLNITP